MSRFIDVQMLTDRIRDKHFNNLSNVCLLSYFDRKGGLHRSGSRRVQLSDPARQSDAGQEAAGPDGEPGL